MGSAPLYAAIPGVPLAQLVEQLTFNQRVAGSIPAGHTNISARPVAGLYFPRMLLFQASRSSSLMLTLLRVWASTCLTITAQ